MRLDKSESRLGLEPEGGSPVGGNGAVVRDVLPAACRCGQEAAPGGVRPHRPARAGQGVGRHEPGGGPGPKSVHRRAHGRGGDVVGLLLPGAEDRRGHPEGNPGAGRGPAAEESDLRTRTEKKADPELVEGLVKDLDAGIDSLRRSGHNIIFANISLKTLREVPEVPEAATPARGRSGEDAAELRDEVPFPDAGGTRVARHSPCHPPTIRAFGTVRRCKVRTCFRSSRRDCAKPCWNTWRLSRLSATA